MQNNNKIWIDLDNSPHVLFFRPIIEELRKRGFHVTLTARDAYQVFELADKYGFEYHKIGRHYGKNKLKKFLGTFVRSLMMARVVIKEKPKIALSHGSRSQQILAGILGLPSIMIFDYEHSTALDFFHPTWIMIPEVIPDEAIKFTRSRVFKYPGIKEDVYIPNFKPDAAIMEELGINESHTVVTFRPPATEAHYHNPVSEILFRSSIEHLATFPETRIVLLPRNKHQKLEVQRQWSNLFREKKMILPDHAVDGPNLIWHSDFVISGGGTMNREAAALGVPVYSIFQGKTGAVDQYLIRLGRLTLLNSPEDIYSKMRVEKRTKGMPNEFDSSRLLEAIVDKIVQIFTS